MKLAIIADALDNQNAGVHVYTREMIKSLIRFNPGWEIILIRQKRDKQLNGVKQIVLKSIALPVGYASLRLFILIPLILTKEKVDVVIEPAHFGPFNLPKRIRRITVIHDLTPILFPHLHRIHSQMLQRLFLKKILSKADLVVANSEHTKKDIINYFPFTDGKVIRIYPGVGLGEDSGKYSNTDFSLEKSPYFLTVGTIEPRKNHLLILKAFELFKQTDQYDTNLVVCGGSGWKSKPFFDALNSSPAKDNVYITGYVDKASLLTLYRFSIAMIYVSTYEGFGFPVAEAISADTIPIVNYSSSLTEVTGEDGLYLKEGKAEDLTSLMQYVTKLSEEERATLKAKLKKHIRKFSWDSFGKELWTAILDL